MGLTILSNSERGAKKRLKMDIESTPYEIEIGYDVVRPMAEIKTKATWLKPSLSLRFSSDGEKTYAQLPTPTRRTLRGHKLQHCWSYVLNPTYREDTLFVYYNQVSLDLLYEEKRFASIHPEFVEKLLRRYDSEIFWIFAYKASSYEQARPTKLGTSVRANFSFRT